MSAPAREGGAANVELAITGCQLYDGLGNPAVTADIGISGDRIVAIGPGVGAAARSVIDARGLAAAPGFIDVHTHDDLAVLTQPDVAFKAMQGVTTDIVGNCGFGAAPHAAAMSVLGAISPGALLPAWDGYAGYMRAIEAAPPSINVAVLAGHGTIRAAVMGTRQSAPSDDELRAMLRILDEALAAGVVGLSTGLIYEPGRHAGEAEITALAAPTAAAGGVYATHMRNEGVGLLESIAETLRVTAATGVRTQISHHKASGRANWGLVERSIALIEAAVAAGHQVSADQYPYTAGSTVLEAVLAAGALVNNEGPVGKVGAGDVLIAAAPKHPAYEGRTLEALAAEAGAEPLAFARRLYEEEGNGCVVVLELMSEDDVTRVMRHPTTMIGSDGVPAGSKPHPRLYGTFPRVLGRYARDRGVISMESAIHKMTAMPAQAFGLTDRGTIRVGAVADIVLFDPDRVLDTADYAQPTRSPAGIAHVLVNGAVAVRDGAQTDARAGRVLHRRP